MQVMPNLYSAWARTPVPALARVNPPTPRAWPADLRMCATESDEGVVLVSFALGRLTELTRAELAVARWAGTGHSNASIASVRRTSTRTVARQMASVLSKLRIGARMELATMPELVPWSPPRLRIQVPPGLPLDSLLLDEGPAIDPSDMPHIWCAMASGRCQTLAAADTGGTGHVAIRCPCSAPIDWQILSERERDILELMAGGLAQKCIAMKLGLAPATVSFAVDSVRKRLGFASGIRLLRAYCGARAVS
jgi:DNA-binding CsgD family transcriptional regulator